MIAAGGAFALAAVAAAANVEIVPRDSASFNPLTWTGDGFLPYPTNFYTVEDPSTPTGLRLHLPEPARRDVIMRAMPFDTQDWEERVRSKDGFSPNFPVTLAIPAVLKDRDLPRPEDSISPHAPIGIYCASDGHAVPYRIFLQVLRSVGGPQTSVLRIYPLGALDKGERHVVVIRSSLGEASGKQIPPSPGFLQLSREVPPEDPALASAWRRFEPVRRFLAAQGWSAPQVALAFDFTVESDESYTAQARALAGAVRAWAERHPFKPLEWTADDDHTLWDWAPTVQVEGHLDVPQFIDGQGRLRLPSPEAGSEPETRPVDFKLILPRAPVEGGAPIVVFGHGFMVNKDTMFQVAGRLAKAGIAVIGVNAPFHRTVVSPLKVVLSSRGNMEIIAGMFYQNIAQQLMLIQLVRQGLAGLDVLPLSEGESGGDGRQDLDPSRILYVGQSMGGISGASVLALDPGLIGGVLNVAGGSFGDLFEESWLISQIGLPFFDLDGLEPIESYLATGLMGYLTDPVDPVGMAPYVTRSRYLNATPKAVMVQAGLNDGLVPNGSSDRLARAFGIPAIRFSKRDVPFVEQVDRPYHGPGLYTYRFGQGRFFPHLCLMGDEASEDAVEFLLEVLRSARQVPAAGGAGAAGS